MTRSIPVIAMLLAAPMVSASVVDVQRSSQIIAFGAVGDQVATRSKKTDDLDAFDAAAHIGKDAHASQRSHLQFDENSANAAATLQCSAGLHGGNITSGSSFSVGFDVIDQPAKFVLTGRMDSDPGSLAHVRFNNLSDSDLLYFKSVHDGPSTRFQDSGVLEPGSYQLVFFTRVDGDWMSNDAVGRIEGELHLAPMTIPLPPAAVMGFPSLAAPLATRFLPRRRRFWRSIV